MDAKAEIRALYGEALVSAPIGDVWQAWTTEEGVRSFLAPECRVEPQPDGLYEAYFDLAEPPGLRGGEGNRVLAVQPPKMLSFTWNSPPSLPTVRGQRTHVTVRLNSIGAGQTRVTLAHDGWGNGGEWDEAFTYFQRAWFGVVLPRLRYRFALPKAAATVLRAPKP